MSEMFEVLDDGRRKVVLDKEIETAAGKCSVVFLRPPTAGDFLELGDPTAAIWSADSASAVPVDDMPTIAAYVGRLADVSPEALKRQGSLRVGKALAAAVKSFFREIDAKN